MKIWTIVCGLLVTLPVCAEEAQPVQTSTDETIGRVDAEPFPTKLIYRSAWEADNQAEYSYMAQIEAALAAPSIPPELRKQLEKEKEIASSISYGLKGKDIPTSEAFQSDSSGILDQTATRTLLNRPKSPNDLKALIPSEEERDRLLKERDELLSPPVYPNLKLSDF